MVRLATLGLCLAALAPAAAQDRPPEECRRGGICLCKWTWSDRPYTNARNYFITEDFWKRIHRVCWGEIAQYECVEKPRGRKQPKEICSPVLDRAFEEARRRDRLVLFLGMTGG